MTDQQESTRPAPLAALLAAVAAIAGFLIGYDTVSSQARSNSSRNDSHSAISRRAR